MMIEQDEFDTSDDALALNLGREFNGDVRYVHLFGSRGWLFWDGNTWRPDEKLSYVTRIRSSLRRLAYIMLQRDEEKFAKTAHDLRSDRKVAAVASMVRSNSDIAALPSLWDGDQMVCNTPAGLVHLPTGQLMPPDREAFCTKSTALAPAPPGTPAPLWSAFLERIFRHDPELIGFMKRVLGYSLTGSTKEHSLIFCWGEGGNGKGVLLNTVTRILGDYAGVAPADMFLASYSDRHPTDMAMMRGKRLVIAQKVPPGKAWDESKIKSLTAGDPVQARFMRCDPFEYTPQFTLIIAGNNKSSFADVDQAIRRRVMLVPFLQNITGDEVDKDLPAKLEAEYPAILRWMIDGCLAWQAGGLQPPRSVTEASEDVGPFFLVVG
ncbi:MAG: phage/plasmid primase, P4 family [Phycisphaerales bacterium]|nr:phage/plasmid primase, P4 family [Phycisphaerales bacterium]